MKINLEETVLNIISMVIGGERIRKEDLDISLRNIGIDSVIFIQVVVAIEEEFGCMFPDEKLVLDEMNTVRNIVEVLRQMGIDDNGKGRLTDLL